MEKDSFKLHYGKLYLRRAEEKHSELLEKSDSAEAKISEFLVEGE